MSSAIDNISVTLEDQWKFGYLFQTRILQKTHKLIQRTSVSWKTHREQICMSGDMMLPEDNGSTYMHTVDVHPHLLQKIAFCQFIFCWHKKTRLNRKDISTNDIFNQCRLPFTRGNIPFSVVNLSRGIQLMTRLSYTLHAIPADDLVSNENISRYGIQLTLLNSC